MDLADFIEAVERDRLPEGLAPELRALGEDARGDWDCAHRTVQDVDTAEAAWVHAYLHRKEGDLANARYWYRRARRSPSELPLDREWREIAAALLGRA